MAFVFLNRFLDIYDAIEDGSTDMLDHSDFADTDVPYDIILSEDHSIPVICEIMLCHVTMTMLCHVTMTMHYWLDILPLIVHYY